MICAKRFQRSVFVAAVATTLLGVACGAETALEEESESTDQELQSRDSCGNSNFMRVSLVGMCPKKSKWQWSKCYSTGTVDREGNDTDDRLATDRSACSKAGGVYMCGRKTTAYQPCSCCKSL